MNNLDYYYQLKNREQPSSKARSKLSPKYQNLEKIKINAIDKGRYIGTALSESNSNTYYCVKGNNLSQVNITVGDHVAIIPAENSNPDNLSRIVKLLARKTILSRTVDDYKKNIKLFSANHEQVLIIVASIDPDPDLLLIARILLATVQGGAMGKVIITKTDLTSNSTLENQLKILQIPYQKINPHLPSENLLYSLDKKTSVMIGMSGVGKSTLLNRLVPKANRKIGAVGKKGQGKHTSSQSIAYQVSPKTWLIDTPGIRSFGIGEITQKTIYDTFPQLKTITQQCPPKCTHYQETDTNNCNITKSYTDATIVNMFNNIFKVNAKQIINKKYPS